MVEPCIEFMTRLNLFSTSLNVSVNIDSVSLIWVTPTIPVLRILRASLRTPDGPVSKVLGIARLFDIAPDFAPIGLPSGRAGGRI